MNRTPEIASISVISYGYSANLPFDELYENISYTKRWLTRTTQSTSISHVWTGRRKHRRASLFLALVLASSRFTRGLCLCLRRPGSHVAYACVSASVVRVSQPRGISNRPNRPWSPPKQGHLVTTKGARSQNAYPSLHEVQRFCSFESRGPVASLALHSTRSSTSTGRETGIVGVSCSIHNTRGG